MLIDSHCHIPHEYYKKTPEDIIRDARLNNVEGLILIGTSLEENKATLGIVRSFENIYCCLGIYPHEDISIDVATLIKELKKQLIEGVNVVGLGEIGVDILGNEETRDLSAQMELFEAQLELAKELNLPVSIHNRNADAHIINALKDHTTEKKGVFHCFTQDIHFAKKVLDLGFYISFTGIITYQKNEVLRDVVRLVPHDRYLVETDSPYLPPQGHRGEVNYPEYVKIVAEKVAQVRGESYEDVVNASYKNTCALFGLDQC